MGKLRGLAAFSVGAVATTTLAASDARAHFEQLQGTHTARSGGFTGIKAAPCGVAGSTRGSNVYTYKPGSTITISVDEYIPHPGYYRIAFDQDGDDDFEVPASISGEHGDCAGDPLCGPGMEDFCSNDTVLLDNLDAHPSMPGVSFTWNVTLPNVECDNCTLQIIQVMSDFDLHPAAYGAYFDPSADPLGRDPDDIYFQCIDLVLSNAATNELGTPAESNGINCKADAPMGGAGGMDGMTGGAGGMTGGAEGMTGGTGAPPAGGTGGAGGMTGGAGGGSGAAGVAAGGIGGMGVAGTTGGAAPTAPTAPNTAEESSCSIAHSGASAGAFAPLMLALAWLFTRKRR